MSRQNFTDNASSIKPDRDEIKVFNNQAKGSGYAYSRDYSDPKKTVDKPKSSKLGKLLWWLLIFALGAGGWFLNNRLTDMEFLLDLSRSELDHSRKRIGQLEALVVATDASANKSGIAVQAQVNLLGQESKARNQFVDTELDKLWGVALRTNQAQISENTKAMENNAVNIQQNVNELQNIVSQFAITSEVFSGISDLNQTNAQKLEAQQKQLNKLTQTLDNKVANLLAAINQDAQQVQIDIISLKAQLESVSSIQQNIQTLADRLNINEQDVQAINSFRLTTNKKLLLLESQLRNAQLGASN